MPTARIWKVATAATACLIAAACTGGAPQSSDDGDSKSITYLIEEPEDAAALKGLKQHIATFEKDSGISVKVRTLPFENMRTVLQTQLRSGEGPDVFSWGSGPSFGGALAKAGLVHDLTDAYEENGWEVYDFAKERVTVDGKVYGIPGEMEIIGLFYNKKILDSLGIAEISSLDDLMAACGTIKDAGMTPMAVANKEGWEGGHMLSMSLSSRVGGEGMDELFAGDASWDSPEVTSAIGVWKDFNDSGCLPESPTSIDYDSSLSLFYDRKSPILPTGSCIVGEIDDETNFEVGYVPLPATDGPGVFASGLGSGPFISETSSKKDAALEFLDFLASDQHAQWTVENLHTIPARPLDTSTLDVSPLFRRVLDNTKDLATSGDFGYNIDVMTSDAFNEAMYDGMQAVLTGQRTPEEVAADLQAASEK